MIEIENLYKSFGKKKVLKNIDLKIEKGMFGLLGPNGAGKTTLISILTTLEICDMGNVKIMGFDIKNKRKIRDVIGYLPQDFNFYGNFSVYQTLNYLALISGIKNKINRKNSIEKLLNDVNLEKNYKTKVRELSGGMLRRLGIASSLINEPEILIVDEPTAGLDPEERIRIRNLLSGFSKNKIVIISTHIIQDIELSCEKLAVIRDGNIVFEGRVKDLNKFADGKVWSFYVSKSEYEEIVSGYDIISSVFEDEKVFLKVVSDKKPNVKAINCKVSIEDSYMYLIKKQQFN
jgi:ABC-2 type transport system ATP-binding protein